MSISSAAFNAVTNPPLTGGDNATFGRVVLMLLGVLVLDFAWVKILKEGGAL